MSLHQTSKCSYLTNITSEYKFSKHGYCKKKGKVSFGQESLRGESTATVCGVKYQRLAGMLLK